MTEEDSPGTAPPRQPQPWTDLGPRLVSAAVIIAIVATGLHFGGYVWAALAALVFGIAYREWEQMVTLKPLAPLGMVQIALLAAAALAFPVFGPPGTLAAIAVAMLVALFGERSVIVWRLGGLAFFALVLIAVLGMRGTGAAGVVAGWYLGIVIAFNDTGAFFVGRLVGGPKLAPTVSPSKTISGAVGGWVIGTVAGTVYWLAFTPSPWWLGLLLSAVLGVAGQGGDLTESAIKRLFRIKDSGDIIPGHGGFMDRLDSVTFGVIVLFAIGVARGGLDAVAAGFLYW